MTGKLLLVFICGLVAGYIIGRWRRDNWLWSLCRAQQARGDYWCNKYMHEVRDDWPFSVDD